MAPNAVLSRKGAGAPQTRFKPPAWSAVVRNNTGPSSKRPTRTDGGPQPTDAEDAEVLRQAGFGELRLATRLEAQGLVTRLA